MAILPTSNINTSFLSQIDSSLILEEEPTPLELLRGAVESLKAFDDPAQANVFVERLQQVSPAIANRIFHLTWEHSGNPRHLGNRFGEEAFFGYWGRSIDPAIKLAILQEVLKETAAINQQAPSAPESHNISHPLYITEIALEILSYCDLQTLGRLARVNKFFKACVKDYDEKVDLEHVCPGLTILDAKAQGMTAVDDEPRTSKLQILKYFKELSPLVEDGEGLTLLTMSKGLTLNKLKAIAAENGIKVKIGHPPILEELRDIPVEQTYIILITNNVFQGSRNKHYYWQEAYLADHGCVVPTIQEYIALYIFTYNICKKYLYRGDYGTNNPTYGRSSTRLKQSGVHLLVGGSSSARIHITPNGSFDDESHGAGAQRRLLGGLGTG